MLPDAQLGGSGEADVAPDVLKNYELTFRDVAAAKLRSPALAAAIVNPEVEVFRYTHKESGLTEYFTAAEVAERPDAAKWRQGERVHGPPHNLLLSGTQARDFGVATETVNSFTDFKALYGLSDDPQLVEPNVAMQLIEALNNPGLTLLLLLIGGAALYAELHTPGVGVGAFVAAVCFVLFFWSKYLGGTAGWLEVLLFALGTICILIEIFVFPGVGIFGLGGGLLVISSLVLASQTFVLPRNEYQMEHLRTSLLVIVGAIGGTLVATTVMRRYLPHAPMFNRVYLAPPSGDELTELSRRESLGAFEHLLHSRGTTTTPLVPGGKARFGDQLVDVVSDGEFIDRGLAVEVAEVQGTRVVVRAVSA
ncbi:MAG: NfeD family protein [Pirellulales bacterium]